MCGTAGMCSYALSQKADEDIATIARDSVEKWGLARAERYVLELHDAFERLSEFPDMGRRVDEVRPGYLQWGSASHVIFNGRPRLASFSCGSCMSGWISRGICSARSRQITPKAPSTFAPHCSIGGDPF